LFSNTHIYIIRSIIILFKQLILIIKMILTHFHTFIFLPFIKDSILFCIFSRFFLLPLISSNSFNILSLDSFTLPNSSFVLAKSKINFSLLFFKFISSTSFFSKSLTKNPYGLSLRLLTFFKTLYSPCILTNKDLLSLNSLISF